MTALIRKIPPTLPLPAFGREKIPKEVPRFAGFGKEGRGEIFPCLCQFNFETLDKYSFEGEEARIET
jgi:hypothetical protein